MIITLRKMMIKKILSFLDPAQKKSFFFLIVLSVLVALVETMGVASVMPFIAILNDPSIIENSEIFNNVYNFAFSLGIKNKEDFIIAIGIFFFFILLFSNVNSF